MSDTFIEKTFDSLPDIWFDWYARLVPGTSPLYVIQIPTGFVA